MGLPEDGSLMGKIAAGLGRHQQGGGISLERVSLEHTGAAEDVGALLAEHEAPVQGCLPHTAGEGAAPLVGPHQAETTGRSRQLPVGLPVAEGMGFHTGKLPAAPESTDHPGPDQGEQIPLIGVIAHPLEIRDVNRLLMLA